MLIREKSVQDAAACRDLLMQVHALDGYPPFLPDDVSRFITPEYETVAWVAERAGDIVGHVALHRASVDPTLAAAQRATGLPAERLVVIARLFTAPSQRRTGVGRALLRHATTQAHAFGQRAVLDVAHTFLAPIALYESEGWERLETLALRVSGSTGGNIDESIDRNAVGETVADLWVYLSPEAPGS